MVAPGFESKILPTWATSHAGAVNLKLILKMLKGTKAVLSGLKLVSGSGAAVLAHNGMLVPRVAPRRGWGRGNWQGDPVNSANREIEAPGSDPLKHFLLSF